MMTSIGKWLLVGGGVLMLLGLVMYFFGDKLTWLGRLPGDIRIQNPNGTSFYFPIATCLLLSVLLSVLMALIRRFLA